MSSADLPVPRSGGIVASRCVTCGSRLLDSKPAVLMPFVAHRALNWTPVQIDESWHLRTIPTGQGLSICRSLRCADCGLIFMDLRFSDEEMTRLYHDYRGSQYSSLREIYEPGYLSRNESLERGCPYLDKVEEFLAPYLSVSPFVLDWGGDTGRNAPFSASRAGLDVFDISDRAVLPNARRVTRSQLHERRYDLVVLSNVLEHVPYPAKVLDELSDALTTETVLYIEVPFEPIMRLDGATALSVKRHWHEHINFFSPQSLATLLEKSGFVVESIIQKDVVAFGGQVGILQSVSRKLK